MVLAGVAEAGCSGEDVCLIVPHDGLAGSGSDC